MKKITLLFSVIMTCLLTLPGSSQSKENLADKAARIHKSVLTIDTHSDTPMNLSRDGFDVGKRNDQAVTGTKVDFPRMKEGGLDAQFFAVFISQGPRNPEGDKNAKKKALEILEAIRES